MMAVGKGTRITLRTAAYVAAPAKDLGRPRCDRRRMWSEEHRPPLGNGGCKKVHPAHHALAVVGLMKIREACEVALLSSA